MKSENTSIDVVRHADAGSNFSAKLEMLGTRIFTCPSPRSPLRHASAFMKILSRYGPYDVVHSHLQASGLILMLARLGGVPIRIATCHNPVRNRKIGGIERAYYRLLDRWLSTYMHRGMAVSPPAAKFMFGGNWKNDSRISINPCAIDLQPFRQSIDRAQMRRSLGIPAQALVLAQVGRFSEEKNHAFTVSVARALFSLRKDAWLLFVGDGRLQEQIRAAVREQGMEPRVIFTGRRDDVVNIMSGAIDVLIHPSHHEGLPLIAVEAQTAACPVVVSEGVPGEADIIPELVSRLSLAEPIEKWVQAILDAQAGARPSPAEVLETMEQSCFNIQHQAAELTRMYLE